MIAKIGIVILLIGVNAYFAASEVALLSLNERKIKAEANKGSRKAKLILKLLKDPSQFLATIQIGITLAGFLASAFAAESFADELVMWLVLQGVRVSEAILKGVIVAVITILLSYFTLVFGELVPKRIAMQHPNKLALKNILLLNTLAKITRPFVKLLTGSTNFFISVLGSDPHYEGEAITENEIMMLINEGEERGTIEEDERKMIYNIFDFDNKVAQDIMTHRTQIVALPLSSSIQEIVDFLSTPIFTRIPIYERNMDHIVGILYVKDLIPLINQKVTTSFDLSKILRQPFFIPETKRVDNLLKDMRDKKVHMAIVVDEYGGTSGLITIEDLIEEIVGNISDEYDYNEVMVQTIGTEHYLVDGSIHIQQIEALIGEKIPHTDYETLSGFVIDQIGHIPKEDEMPELTIGHWFIKVNKIRGKRITELEIKKIND